MNAQYLAPDPWSARTTPHMLGERERQRQRERGREREKATLDPRLLREREREREREQLINRIMYLGKDERTNGKTKTPGV